MNQHRWVSILVAGVLLAGPFFFTGSTLRAEGGSHTFPQTGKTVQGLFLDYWNTRGGLAQQGYPVSAEMQERSDTDGQTYTMQYFERAVFEAHPENQPPYNVELSLLGTARYQAKYGGAGAPNQHTSTDTPRLFPATGKTVGGAFRKYWEAHGGLAQQGYPLSEEFAEVSPTDGKPYTVQYFERAVFELHPEQTNPDYQVLLSLLGVFYYDAKHGGGVPPAPPAATTTPVPAPPPVDNTGQVLFYNSTAGKAFVGHVDASGNYTDVKVAVAGGATGWTHIVALGSGRLLFYNTNNGRDGVGQVATDGTYSDVPGGIYKLTLGSGWTHLASAGKNLIVYYKDTTSTGGTARVNADGTITLLKVYTTFGTGWTHIVGLDNGVLLFYQRGTATAATLRADSEGNLTTLKTFNNWTPIWTNLVPGINGTVLQYYSLDGRAVVSQFDSNGNETVLARYPSSTGEPPLPNPFPIVAGLSNGTLLFYNDGARSAVTARLSGDGSIPIYNRIPAGTFQVWTHIVAIK